MTANDDFQSLKQSSNFPIAEGERHCDPDPHGSFDDDDPYLNLLRQVTHYPNDYHHGRSAAVDTFSPIQDSPPSFRMDDGSSVALTEIPDCLSLDLSCNLQDLPEGPIFTSGLLHPSPRTPSYDAQDEYLESVLKLSWFANDQVCPHVSFQPGRPIKVIQ